MSLSDELAYVSATELALRIRRHQLSPVEIVDAFIERIEQRNPRGLGESQRDEILDCFRVFLSIRFKPGRLDQFIHCRILVRHRVEQRILSVVVPIEKIFRVGEPGAEAGRPRSGSGLPGCPRR